jgi:hypothetical protein
MLAGGWRCRAQSEAHSHPANAGHCTAQKEEQERGADAESPRKARSITCCAIFRCVGFSDALVRRALAGACHHAASATLSASDDRKPFGEAPD